MSSSSTRIKRLVAVAALAAVIVTGAVVASSSSSGSPGTVPQSAPDQFAGIPEHRGVLGNPKAPITVTEFVDPQCPVCAAAAREVLPSVLNDYVRAGKVKLDARVLHFIGPDSVTAARYAAGARAQDRLWPFLETLFASQGVENEGYVTAPFLARVADAAGVDDAAAARHAATPAADRELATANAEAQRLGVTGTPTFVITRPDGGEQVVSADELDAALAR